MEIYHREGYIDGDMSQRRKLRWRYITERDTQMEIYHREGYIDGDISERRIHRWRYITERGT